MVFPPCAFPIFLSYPQNAFKRKTMLIFVFLQAGQNPQSLSRSMWQSTLMGCSPVHALFLTYFVALSQSHQCWLFAKVGVEKQEDMLERMCAFP